MLARQAWAGPEACLVNLPAPRATHKRRRHWILQSLMQPPACCAENITLGNLSYFLAAPTLCYQPVYPRRWAAG